MKYNLSNFSGLTKDEIKLGLEKWGNNYIENPKHSGYTIFLNQFKSLIVLTLSLSALITLFTGNQPEALIIFVIILINAIVGFSQEYKANNLIKSIEKLISNNITVIRDKKIQEIDKKYVTVGELLYLKIGDFVAADCELLASDQFELDESSLTGESIKIYKLINDRVFSGSVVTSGTAIARVTAIGKNSKFGLLETLTLKTKKISEYQTNLDKITKGFLAVGLVYIIIIFGLHLALGKITDIKETLLFMLALSLSLIPETLPLISRIAMSKQSYKLSKRGMIVKNQNSIEDLGNIDILCTDKTGTITQNKLKITEFDKNLSDQELQYLHLTSLNSTDSFDKAIQEKLETNQDNSQKSAIEILPELINEQPFDPVKKYSTRIFTNFEIYKGAPEELLKISNLSTIEQTNKLKEITAKAEQNGLRVLSVMIKKDNFMEYLCTIYFFDDLKPDSQEIVKQAKKFNLEIKILTGDSLEVARSVAQKINLVDRNQTETKVILASDLDYNNPENLSQEALKYNCFARCNPIQKLQIIEALQKTKTVAYLGDGINDIPALKLATVGIVVNSASDIAKETSDVILIKPDLLAIIEGIKSGREVFENINKYIKQSLCGSFGNFFTIGLISLIINFQPMLSIQILITNLITDLPTLQLAGDSVPSSEIRKPKHQSIARLLIFILILGIVSSIFDFVIFAFWKDQSSGIIQSSWFLYSIMAELVLIFAVRSKKSILKTPLPNKSFMITWILTVIVAIYIAISGFKLINIQTISIFDLVKILGVSLIYLITTEIVKYFIYKFYITEKNV